MPRGGRSSQLVLSVHIAGFRECRYSQRAVQAADVLEHSGLIGPPHRQIFETREEFMQASVNIYAHIRTFLV